MKFIILVLCTFAIAVQANYDVIFRECLGEYDIKEGEFEKLAEREDPKLRCFMACIMEKEEVIKNGEIDKEKMKKIFVSEVPEVGVKKASEIVDTCLDLAKDVSEICTMSNVLGLCVKEEVDKLKIKLRK